MEISVYISKGIYTFASNLRNYIKYWYHVVSADQQNDNPVSSSELSNEFDHSKVRGIKMGSLNFNCLSKHIDQLKIYMEDGIFYVFAINEPKLDQYDSNNLINIPGYTCIQNDWDKLGQGVCNYVCNSINLFFLFWAGNWNHTGVTVV